MKLKELNKKYGYKFNKEEFIEARNNDQHPVKAYNNEILKEYVWDLDVIWGHYANGTITRSKARELSIVLLDNNSINSSNARFPIMKGM